MHPNSKPVKQIERKQIYIISALACLVLLFLGANETAVYKFGLTAHGNIASLMTHVFVHNGMEHLLANLYFFIPIVAFMFLFEGRKAFLLLTTITLMQGIVVWVFGIPEVVYAGSSGLAYGCGVYVLAKGLLSIDKRYMLFSAGFLAIYLPVFMSFMDEGKGISDLSHVAGTVSGLIIALANFVFRPARAF